MSYSDQRVFLAQIPAEAKQQDPKDLRLQTSPGLWAILCRIRSRIQGQL